MSNLQNVRVRRIFVFPSVFDFFFFFFSVLGKLLASLSLFCFLRDPSQFSNRNSLKILDDFVGRPFPTL